MAVLTDLYGSILKFGTVFAYIINRGAELVRSDTLPLPKTIKI